MMSGELYYDFVLEDGEKVPMDLFPLQGSEELKHEDSIIYLQENRPKRSSQTRPFIGWLPLPSFLNCWLP